jgi:hypothetical protein
MRGLPLIGPIWQTTLQIVPEKDYYMCRSKLQIYKCLVMIYKWNFANGFTIAIYKLIYVHVQVHVQVHLQVKLQVS